MSVSGNPPQTDAVKKRQVYYLSGYDPRGARFYHQLCRDEAARQAVVSGVEIKVGSRTKSGEHAVSWPLQTHAEGAVVHTRYTFLGWDSVVRAHWVPSIWRVIGQLPVFYWAYGRAGAIARMWRCAPQSAATVVLPMLFALVTLLLAGLVAALLGSQLSWFAGLPLGVAMVWGGAKLGDRWRLFWLSRILLFIQAWAWDEDGALEQHWQALANEMASDLSANPDVDEVLLVGHSVGSIVAVAVLANLLEKHADGVPTHKLRLLTLGQIVPMLSFWPIAERFRAHVQRVARSTIPWVDFSAPADPLCMVLTNPLTGANVPGDPNGRVAVRSARFDRMFDAAEYSRLRKDGFRIHFQYLMATAKPVANDYFSMVAGPRPLTQWMEPRT